MNNSSAISWREQVIFDEIIGKGIFLNGKPMDCSLNIPVCLKTRASFY